MIGRCLAFVFLVGLAACATDPAREAPPPVAERAEPKPPPPEPEASEPEPSAMTGDRQCLAMALYHEARGEGAEAMRAVAHVILNRANSSAHPSSVCGVVKEGGEAPPCQFSFWCDGRPDVPAEEEEWQAAQGIADRVLAGGDPDPTGGATYYHASHVSPSWRESFTETGRVGGHVFYTE